MKTQMNPTIWLLTLVTLFALPHRASAYYDPGVQRWINRDPVQEPGFEVVRGGALWPHLNRGAFQFVENDPLDQIDPLDLSSVYVELLAAIAKGDCAAIEAILEAGEGVLSEAQVAAGRAALSKLCCKAADWIAKCCKGSINREFPSEWCGKTLEAIKAAARAGDKTAQKAWKLLNDKRFQKCCP